MTVGELIDILDGYDKDKDIIIGMKQRYGSDFTYDICKVEEYNVLNFYGPATQSLVLLEGAQTGVLSYEDDWEEEYDE